MKVENCTQLIWDGRNPQNAHMLTPQTLTSYFSSLHVSSYKVVFCYIFITYKLSPTVLKQNPKPKTKQNKNPPHSGSQIYFNVLVHNAKQWIQLVKHSLRGTQPHPAEVAPVCVCVVAGSVVWNVPSIFRAFSCWVKPWIQGRKRVGGEKINSNTEVKEAYDIGSNIWFW